MLYCILGIFDKFNLIRYLHQYNDNNCYFDEQRNGEKVHLDFHGASLLPVEKCDYTSIQSETQHANKKKERNRNRFLKYL